MTILDKATFLAAFAPKITQVEIEGVGNISIRQLTLKEVEDMQKVTEGDKESLGLRLVAASVVNDAGERMLDDGDIEALHTSASNAMSDLALAVMKVNGLVTGTEESPN